MRRAFVLSGGGALGAIQVGALRALLEHDIRPDFLVGCSVGALNASFLATDVSFAELDRAADVWHKVTTRTIYPGGKLSTLWRFISGKDSLHDNRSYYRFLQEVGCTPALTFGHMQGAGLFITATHLRTGNLHVFGDDPNDRVLDALMASTALTPLHPPWSVFGEAYVDGGTVTPLPIRVAIERGATEVYALHLTSPPGEFKPVHGVAAHIHHTVSTMLRQQADHDLQLAEEARRVKLHYLPLMPPHKVVSTDFGQTEELLASGYEQTLRLLVDEGAGLVAPQAWPRRQWWPQLFGRRPVVAHPAPVTSLEDRQELLGRSDGL